MSLRTLVTQLQERVTSLDRLMEAKFVTFRTLLDSQAEKVKLALDAADKAVAKAETSVNDRLNAMNEFRGALSDSQANNVTRAEFEQFRAAHSAQVAELKERIDKSEGRSGGVGQVWGVIVAVAGIAIAIAVLVLG